MNRYDILQIVLLIGIITIVCIIWGLRNFIKSYFDEKAKHLATKENFNTLLEQLKTQTKETENIKKEIEDLYGYKAIKRQKLENLLNYIYSYKSYLTNTNKQNKILTEEFDIDDFINNIDLIINLYFKIEFSDDIKKFKKIMGEYKIKIMDLQICRDEINSKLKIFQETKNNNIDTIKKTYKDYIDKNRIINKRRLELGEEYYPKIIHSIYDIEEKSYKIMQELINNKQS